MAQLHQIIELDQGKKEAREKKCDIDRRGELESK
jgi:hypothetical protein